MLRNSLCSYCCHNPFKNIGIDEISYHETSLIKAGFCSPQGSSVNYLQPFLIYIHLSHASTEVYLDYQTERSLEGNNELLFCLSSFLNSIIHRLCFAVTLEFGRFWGFLTICKKIILASFLPGFLVNFIDLSLQAFILIQFHKIPGSPFLQPVEVHLVTVIIPIILTHYSIWNYL